MHLSINSKACAQTLTSCSLLLLCTFMSSVLLSRLCGFQFSMVRHRVWGERDKTWMREAAIYVCLFFIWAFIKCFSAPSQILGVYNLRTSVSFPPKKISVAAEAFPAFKPPFPHAAEGRIQREESLISRETERQKVAGIQGDFPVWGCKRIQA